VKLLITGGSGFLGRNIIHLLSRKYEVESLGLSEIDTYNVDISKEIPVFKSKFNIVVHAAGKVHVIPENKNENQLFYDVNVQGTKNLCTALETNGLPDNFIFISTVAVYGLDCGEGISEEHPLNGKTPYAHSKIQAENILTDWCAKLNIPLTILRPSLIAGPNPPGNLGAMIDGIKSGKYLRIGKGQTRKSILMAEDIALLIPKLIQTSGVYNVCDNNHPSLLELENLLSTQLGKRLPLSIPVWLAKIFAKIGDLAGGKLPFDTSKLNKLTNTLTFSNEKAKKDLDWKPLDVLTNYKVR